LKPAAILFDFGGTLDADGTTWKERFSRLFAEEAGRLFPPELFERAFYDSDDALVGAIPRDLPLSETAARLAAGLAERLEVPAAAARRSTDRFLADSRRHLAKSREQLSRLRQRYRLGIVSNFYGNLEAVCREVGLFPSIEVAVDSAVLGVEKPDARIFEAALEALAVRPANALFVGDSMPRDMAGARALGMPHVWLRAGGNDTAPCCPFDRVIGTVADLDEVLS
jgi:HAD superfamily hydrolase (TIGR01549 family)